MITSEEIKLAKSLVDRLNESDLSVLVVVVNRDADTKLQVCGESVDIEKLLERVEDYCRRYSDMLKSKGGRR